MNKPGHWFPTRGLESLFVLDRPRLGPICRAPPVGRTAAVL